MQKIGASDFVLVNLTYQDLSSAKKKISIMTLFAIFTQ